MSDESNETSDRDELHDRLIDRSLREVVGGETPPDLSERILAAAGASVAAVVTPAGVDAMHPGAPDRNATRFPWAALAIAAGLLLAVGYFLLPLRDPTKPNVAQRPVTQENLRRLERSAKPAVAETPDDTKSLREGEAASADFDSLVDLITSTADSEAFAEPGGRQGEFPNNLSLEIGQTQKGVEDGEQSGDRAGAAATETLAFHDLQKDLYGEASGGGQASGEGQPAIASSPTPASGPVADLADDDSGTMRGTRVLATGDGVQQGQQGEQAPAPTSLASIPASANGQDVSQYWAAAAPATPAAGGVPVDSYAAEARGLNRQWAEAEVLSAAAGGGYGGRRTLSDGVTDGLGLNGRGGYARRPGEFGRGPGSGGDQYARIVENAFQAINAATTDNRLSTFSIDVDTASYANVRQFLMQTGTLPPPDAVRIEELVNYFDYDYTAPTDDTPFAANVEIASCPWKPDHRLVRVGIKGSEMERTQRPKSNLVFLVDVSGSMDEPNKLPLLVEGMRMLTRELGENDRVAIVVYASTEGLALESTRGDKQQEILAALDRLQAGGSTAGGAGIVLAYKQAEENFIEGGVNRVILCTDGDFNVGVTSPADLQRLAEEKAKDTGVFLTVLGFGRGNLNDAMMEQVADHGNGNYHYVDNHSEARKVLVEEMTGTLVTIAKDVKIQVEFNPAQVAGYRLIGYENRVLAAEDFNDDKKDAGEIGAGHTVTALYEVIPAGKQVDAASVDELKYRPVVPIELDVNAASDRDGLEPMASNEMLTLKIRYKQPDGDTSTKLEFPISDNGQAFTESSADFQFAAAVASFGMLLRQSEFKGDATLAGVQEIAEAASRDRDPHGYRKEFVDLVKRARELSGE